VTVSGRAPPKGGGSRQNGRCERGARCSSPLVFKDQVSGTDQNVAPGCSGNSHQAGCWVDPVPATEPVKWPAHRWGCRETGASRCPERRQHQAADAEHQIPGTLIDGSSRRNSKSRRRRSVPGIIRSDGAIEAALRYGGRRPSERPQIEHAPSAPQARFRLASQTLPRLVISTLPGSHR